MAKRYGHHPQPNDYAQLPILQLPSGELIILDPEDYQHLKRYHWKIKRSKSVPYIVRRIKRRGKFRYIRLHREVVDCPSGLEVHHINRNPFDNRKSNLQIVTPSEHRQLSRTARTHKGTP